MLISVFISLIASCFLSILDTSIAHYTGTFTLFTITSFLIISLFIQKLSYFILIPCFLIGFESLLFYDNFSLIFYWTIPTILLALHLKNKMVNPIFAAIISLIFCLLLQQITIFILGYELPLLYCTALQITVNIGIILMSLKCLPTVE